MQTTNIERTSGELYDEEYYKTHLGPEEYSRNNPTFVALFNAIADELLRSLRPATVFDAGCAVGLLVEALWDRGIKAWGVDVSSYAIAQVRRDVVPYCRVASLVEPLADEYDLITCIEVLEHMPEEESLTAIQNLTQATNTILFSSSPEDVTEPTHFNVHQPIWWLERFAEHNFAPDVLYDAGFIAPQAMLLRRTDSPPSNEVLRLFAETIRRKIALRNKDLHINGLSEQLGHLKATIASQLTESAEHLKKWEETRRGLESELEQATERHQNTERELAILSATLESHSAASNEQITTYEETARSLQSALEQSIERQEDADRQIAYLSEILEAAQAPADSKGKSEETNSSMSEAIRRDEDQGTVELRNDLTDLTHRHRRLIEEFERLAHERDGSFAQHHNVDANTRTEIDVLRSRVDQATKSLDDLRSYVTGTHNLAIEAATTAQSNAQDALKHSLAVGAQVRDILNSRIWRTLCSAGSLIARSPKR